MCGVLLVIIIGLHCFVLQTIVWKEQKTTQNTSISALCLFFTAEGHNDTPIALAHGLQRLFES